MAMDLNDIIGLLEHGIQLGIPEQAQAAYYLREYRRLWGLNRDKRLYELPCRVGDTVYAVDICKQRHGNRHIDQAVVVKYTVDHFEIGQADTLFAIACNDNNIWTSLKADEIYDKATAEGVAKVINEIRRGEDAAY